MTGLVSLSNAYTDMQMRIGMADVAIGELTAELDEVDELLEQAFIHCNRAAWVLLRKRAEAMQLVTRVRIPPLSPPQRDAAGSGTGGLTVRQGESSVLTTSASTGKTR